VVVMVVISVGRRDSLVIPSSGLNDGWAAIGVQHLVWLPNACADLATVLFEAHAIMQDHDIAVG
jgi:hypothetical protein